MPTSPIVTHGAAGGLIFGRERELARLDELSEHGAALPVRGEAHIGKSAPHGLADTHKDQLNADLLAFLREVNETAFGEEHGHGLRSTYS